MLQKLGQFKKGQKGMIVSVEPGTDPALSRRLLEMGLIEGGQVELVHEAPLSKDPIAVRVRGSLLALRRSEANLVIVEVKENPS